MLAVKRGDDPIANSFGSTVGGLLPDGLKDIANQANRVAKCQKHLVDDVRILEFLFDDLPQLGFY